MCALASLNNTHETYKSFDANPSLEVRGAFLDISKVFDRVWHDSLLFKLKLLGICGGYDNLIQSFSTTDIKGSFSMVNHGLVFS